MVRRAVREMVGQADTALVERDHVRHAPQSQEDRLALPAHDPMQVHPW